MPWVSVTIEVAAADTEPLTDALLERGAASVEVSDARAGMQDEVPLFGEPGDPDGALWPLNTVNALFDPHSDYRTAVREALASVGLTGNEPLRVGEVAEQDWLRASQQQFGPIEISPKLWIVPTWCEPPVLDAVNLRLDPGLAFGTGSHPTTWQCLRWLEDHLSPGESVLDYGCGSGILAIAAAKLGAANVTGVDVDSNALAASLENARANGANAAFFAPDILTTVAYDVVIANILANPLRVLAPLLAARTRESGRIVLAGILDSQAAAVQAAYAQWFDLAAIYPREGWTCLSGQRR